MKFPSVLKVVSKSLFYNDSGIIHYQSDFYILEYLAEKLKSQYEIVAEGPENEILTYLQKGKADIGMYRAGIRFFRLPYADFAASYGVYDIRFLIEEAGEKPKFEIFASPFNVDVWLTFLSTLLVVTCLLRLTTNVSFSRIILSMLGIVLKQSMDIKTIEIKKLLIVGTWFLGAGLIPMFYSALFLSSLTVPTKERSVRTFQELSYAVQNRGFICRTTYPLYYIMLHSDQEHLRILAQKIAENGWFHDGYPQIGKTEAWIHVKRNLEDIVLRPPNRVKVISEDSLYVQPYCVLVKKDFCCKEQLNAAILDGVETGLFDYYLKTNDWDFEWREELLRLEWSGVKISQIKLKDFQYAIYPLLIGYALSFTVFLLECAIGHYHFIMTRLLRGRKCHRGKMNLHAK